MRSKLHEYNLFPERSNKGMMWIRVNNLILFPLIFHAFIRLSHSTLLLEVEMIKDIFFFILRFNVHYTLNEFWLSDINLGLIWNRQLALRHILSNHSCTRDEIMMCVCVCLQHIKKLTQMVRLTHRFQAHTPRDLHHHSDIQLTLLTDRQYSTDRETDGQRVSSVLHY